MLDRTTARYRFAAKQSWLVLWFSLVAGLAPICSIASPPGDASPAVADPSAATAPATTPSAGEPMPAALHARIDELIMQRLAERQITPAALSSDEEFIRRLYLDLHGMIPTASQAREFLSDPAPDKRSRLIDSLLQHPDYALHMARVFDVLLLERRIPTISSYDVKLPAWRAYLTQAFAENRPWDQLVRELLASDGAEEQHAAAVKFYLVRDVAPHQMTRDVGRLFLGIDLQCAQCHDDPRIESYKQADYYGIYAFLQRISSFRDTKKNISLVSETANGNTRFVSVFTTQRGETFPKLPAGEMISDPMLEKDKEYVLVPGPQSHGVPTYSRRKKLAEQLPRAETAGFARNLANRLWAQLLGRGLVHPLDLHHPDNPASHPELLDALTEFLIQSHFNIQALVREIVLSQTYQRSSLLPPDTEAFPPELFAVAPLRGLSAEQLTWSLLQTAGRVPQSAHVSPSVPSPSGTETAAATPVDPAWKVRLAQLEPLDRQVRTWVPVFAGLPGQAGGEFQPVVDQALHLLNSPAVPALLQDAPSTLLTRVSEKTEAEPMAEELYLSLFSRFPTEDETSELRQVMEPTRSPAEQKEALLSHAWGLLLSAEFRLNH